MAKNLGKNVRKYKEVDLKTVNYIDDSSNIVSFEDFTNANYYLNEFFFTLKEFYNANRLCMNREKIGPVCIARPQIR